MELGLLDFCQLEPRKAIAYQLASAIELAKAAEQLGYSRYWLSEHHEPDIAHSCPEVLAGIIAAETHRINVGTAGVLIRHHDPYRLGKTFQLLTNLFGSRIDCGLSSSLSMSAVTRGCTHVAEDQLDQSLEKFLSVIREPSRLSSGACVPVAWMMGRITSLRRAAQHGTPFALDGLFHLNDLIEMRDSISEYYETFSAATVGSLPYCVLAIAVSCGETDDAARAQVAAYLNLRGPQGVQPTIVGEGERCAARIVEVVDATGAAGAVVVDISTGFYQRLAASTSLIDGFRKLGQSLHAGEMSCQRN